MAITQFLMGLFENFCHQYYPKNTLYQEKLTTLYLTMGPDRMDKEVVIN